MHMKSNKIPEATITRLSVYSRILNTLEKSGIQRVSSNELGNMMDGSAAQVRKDLAYFGEFGTRGVGYDVNLLHKHIMKILGIDKPNNIVIAGAGRVGKSLALYSGFERRGFSILGIFDHNTSRVGTQIGDLKVKPMEELESFVPENNINIGVIAVPALYAQEAADALIKAGVKAIMNFAPVLLNVPNGFPYRFVDLTIMMEILSYYITVEENNGSKKSSSKRTRSEKEIVKMKA